MEILQKCEKISRFCKGCVKTMKKPQERKEKAISKYVCLRHVCVRGFT